MRRCPLSPASRCLPWLALPLLLSALVGCSSGPAPALLSLRLTVASKTALTRQDMEKADGRYVSIRLDPDGMRCRGAGGFSAFRETTVVEVLDQRGDQLGRGVLGPGRVETSGRDLDGEPLYSACHFQADLPLTGQARIYVLRIGGESLVRRLHLSKLRNSRGLVRLTID